MKKSSPPGGIQPPTHLHTLTCTNIPAHTHTQWQIIAAALWLLSKIPCTIKGKGLSVSHVGDYGTEWQGTTDTKQPGWMHLSQPWQVWVTPGAGPRPSRTGISLASCHLSATLLSLTLSGKCTHSQRGNTRGEGYTSSTKAHSGYMLYCVHTHRCIHVPYTFTIHICINTHNMQQI